MNYEPYSPKKSGNYVFYIIVAVALVIIAVIAWIGLGNMTNPSTEPESSINETPNSNNNSQEYQSNDSSYNSSTPETSKDSIPEVAPSTPTEDKVSDQPYQKSYVMPVNGDILKDFSNTTLQFSQTFGDMRLHTAVDIAAKEGTFVSAITNGSVISIEESATYGNVITIDHGDNLIVKYASVKNPKVKVGNQVKAGDIIGTVSTIPCESSDQPHLHIEATQNSMPISVMDFFK